MSEKTDLITVGPASHILVRSPETVRDYAARGLLRVVMAGRVRLFDRAEVERLAAKLNAEAKAA